MPLNRSGNLLEFRMKIRRFSAKTGAHAFVKGNEIQIHMTRFDRLCGWKITDFPAAHAGNGHPGHMLNEKKHGGAADFFAEINIKSGTVPAADQMPGRDRADLRHIIEVFDVHFFPLHKIS